jgi:hypothetical protein
MRPKIKKYLSQELNGDYFQAEVKDCFASLAMTADVSSLYRFARIDSGTKLSVALGGYAPTNLRVLSLRAQRSNP